MKRGAKNRQRRCRGFTLVEVGIAVAVLGLCVASSLVALRVGFAIIETARDNTLASQILQSEMENLRLRNWPQIKSLENGPFAIEASFYDAAASRFSCERRVRDPKPTLREITLQATWTSPRGVTLSRRYVTYFSKDGLNDYYYRSFK